ncbi:hypothetical protein G6F50_016500 [Rhizopus delemar]|uniref:Uncharacterized protein n=1 Tax=Rhizopus delemar TaxID=936053 RepID=A0A9P6XTF1_9FUNG|nr:hypothetical protein G6F50_016500 [Rhizopus delemar]
MPTSPATSTPRANCARWPTHSSTASPSVPTTWTKHAAKPSRPTATRRASSPRRCTTCCSRSMPRASADQRPHRRRTRGAGRNPQQPAGYRAAGIGQPATPRAGIPAGPAAADTGA